MMTFTRATSSMLLDSWAIDRVNVRFNPFKPELNPPYKKNFFTDSYDLPNWLK